MPKGYRRIFTMGRYDVSFPLKHPRYVIENVAYKKAEEDKKKEDEKKPATSEVIVADKKNTSKTAKTADESNIGLNAYMMVGSLTIAGVVVFAIRKKRRDVC